MTIAGIGRQDFESQADWESAVAARRTSKENKEAKNVSAETPAEKLRRRSRDRSYAREIESLRVRADSLRIDDRPTPRYIHGGIVQEDEKEEVVYTLDEVKEWRRFVLALTRHRDAMRCGHCYTLTPKPPLHTMARCSRCRQTRYCSFECQRADFAFHKTKCNKYIASSSPPPSTIMKLRHGTIATPQQETCAMR